MQLMMLLFDSTFPVTLRNATIPLKLKQLRGIVQSYYSYCIIYQSVFIRKLSNINHVSQLLTKNRKALVMKTCSLIITIAFTFLSLN